MSRILSNKVSRQLTLSQEILQGAQPAATSNYQEIEPFVDFCRQLPFLQNGPAGQRVLASDLPQAPNPRYLAFALLFALLG